MSKSVLLWCNCKLETPLSKPVYYDVNVSYKSLSKSVYYVVIVGYKTFV